MSETQHIVLQGECILTIAAKYGFRSWKTLYNHASNSELKEKRPNPMALMPGDSVTIPDKEADSATPEYKSISGQKNHVFVVKRLSAFFTMALLDELDQPMSALRYELSVEGERDIYSGKTDDKGVIRESIPMNAEKGLLSVWFTPNSDDKVMKRTVFFGHKDPVEETSGRQEQLNQLLFDSGRVDNQRETITTDAESIYADEKKLPANEVPVLADSLSHYNQLLDVPRERS